MRDYGRVYSTFWSSETTASLSDDGKLLALYLLTCPHATIAGVFRLPDGYVAEDLRWSPERVVEGFRELFDKGFADRCETTRWVWVRKHLEWNPPENPNQRKAAVKVALSVPDGCAWKRAFMRDSSEVLALPSESSENPSRTVSKPFLNQEQEQEQKNNHCASDDAGAGSSEDRRDTTTRTPDPPGFAEFWTAWPKTDRKQDRKKCVDKWRRNNLGRHVVAIVAHVEAMKRTRKWREGFEPAPLTYLNGERWNDLVGDTDETESASVIAKGYV